MQCLPVRLQQCNITNKQLCGRLALTSRGIQQCSVQQICGLGFTSQGNPLTISQKRQSRCLRLQHWCSASGSPGAASDSGSSHSIENGKSRFRRLWRSEHDGDIFALAIPALFGILLDPIMTMTDSGLHSLHLKHGTTQTGNLLVLTIFFNSH